VSVIQQARGDVSESPGEPRYRRLRRELVSFGLVGGVGTALTFIGANIMDRFFGSSPVTSVVIPMLVSTGVSYLLNRHYTFRLYDSDGSGREVGLFFALNGVGIAIQILCMGFRTYTLGLHGTLSFNVAMAIATTLGGGFRYWSYRKWVFLAAQA
jgi:putative flippase GtrA